jgi:hypothetical protein
VFCWKVVVDCRCEGALFLEVGFDALPDRIDPALFLHEVVDQPVYYVLYKSFLFGQRFRSRVEFGLEGIVDLLLRGDHLSALPLLLNHLLQSLVERLQVKPLGVQHLPLGAILLPALKRLHLQSPLLELFLLQR